MKKLSYIFKILLLILSVSFISCESDESASFDDNNNNASKTYSLSFGGNLSTVEVVESNINTFDILTDETFAGTYSNDLLTLKLTNIDNEPVVIYAETIASSGQRLSETIVLHSNQVASVEFNTTASVSSMTYSTSTAYFDCNDAVNQRDCLGGGTVGNNWFSIQETTSTGTGLVVSTISQSINVISTTGVHGNEVTATDRDMIQSSKIDAPYEVDAYIEVHTTNTGSSPIQLNFKLENEYAYNMYTTIFDETHTIDPGQTAVLMFNPIDSTESITIN